MSITNWDKGEIKKLAHASGKPLEVQCAEAFLKAGWNARLGSYYHDLFSDKIRELDVYIQKQQPLSTNNLQCNVSIRILGSCKGFPPEHAPVTYSVSQSRNLADKPVFMYDGRGHSGPIRRDMGRQGAAHFLHRSGLKESKQVVGFDIFQRKENTKKPDEFEYIRKTDRDLYEGVDSAIKAAFYWSEEDTKRFQKGVGPNERHTTLTIPLLVTSLPFWNITIDEGLPSEPEICHSGYFVGTFPFGKEDRRPQPVMSILWAVSKLGDLIQHLDSLFEAFVDDIKETLNKSR